MSDTLARLYKVTPIQDHREFATVRIDLLQAARSEIEALEKERDAALEILRRISRTHMHNGHCTWCDSDVHERDCFVAAAIAATSRRD
jgi:hypothetical protein